MIRIVAFMSPNPRSGATETATSLAIRASNLLRRLGSTFVDDQFSTVYVRTVTPLVASDGGFAQQVAPPVEDLSRHQRSAGDRIEGPTAPQRHGTPYKRLTLLDVGDDV